ncbi:uncharacterized protein LOC116388237 [Anarrhichthys ocellatus]|uniref:uncharacterized protein LOC116388237 n=1 Tax=Anarrhichthys ocellatus TaxID=433405 RepID=UPI0012ED925D|nr:uncharacterized protein LOC116388237 [Anarrhichthys ocellatus]
MHSISGRIQGTEDECWCGGARGNLATRTVSSSSSSSPSQHKTTSPDTVCSHLDRFYLHRPALIQRRVRLNGSRRAHLPAVRDDRARAGLRLDAVPETERQAPKTSSWTSAAFKRPGVSGSLEYKQPVCQARQRREGPEEEWPHREESLIKRGARKGYLLKSNLNGSKPGRGNSSCGSSSQSGRRVMQKWLCCLFKHPKSDFWEPNPADGSTFFHCALRLKFFLSSLSYSPNKICQYLWIMCLKSKVLCF